MKWEFPHYCIDKGIKWTSIECDYQWYRDMEHVPQDPIWHAEGDVQTHTRMVTVELVNLPEFKALTNDQDKHIVLTAALMHDIEKRSTTTTEIRDGRTCIVAPRHSQRGEHTAREILYKELDCPFEVREEICALVRYHGAPLWGMGDDGWEKKIISISMRCKTNLLAMLAKADVLGRLCDDSDDLLEKIDYFKMGCEENDCFGKPREFKSKLGRYSYLGFGEGYVDYDPFDETKFEVHMMSGVAGSGKDYYINQELSEYPSISLDGIRREFGIKPQAKKANGKVFQAATERCKVLMRERKDFVFNATNITKNMRAKWVSLFESYGGKVIIHYTEAPYHKLVGQNKNREYTVPQKIVDKMIKKLEVPSFNEAYDVKFNIQEQ